MKVMVEYTDTFAGEANYSWCRRETVEMDEKANTAKVKREAKKVIGITGIRGRWSNIGEMLEFRPFGYCTVLFVNFEY